MKCRLVICIAVFLLFHLDGVSQDDSISLKLGYQLDPDKAEVSVNEKKIFHFKLGKVLPDAYQRLIDEDERAYRDVIKLIRRQDVIWLVNGIQGGNQTVGYIEQDLNDPLQAQYFAPANIPANNPVKVEVRLGGILHLTFDQAINILTASAWVTIVEDFEYTFIGYSNTGVFHMIDSSSCTIRLNATKANITAVHNYPPWSDWPTGAGVCSISYPAKDSWKGLVEISGMSTSIVTHEGDTNSNKQSTLIMIGLEPAMGNTPEFKEKCRGSEHTVPSSSMLAQPRSIEFELKKSDILIRLGGEESKNELKHIVNGQGFIIRVRRKPPGS